MKNEQNKKTNIKGFTLIELLVVVLIIGILSAVALPMYRKAVEKSRVADALNTMQAVAKSEHGWYLNNNDYTKDFSDLDIDLIDDEGEKADGATYDTVNYTFTLQDNSIMARRNNNEYTLYKLYEDPNIYCLPQEHEICQQFGWGVNKALCDSINGAWSNKNNACYNSPQERCAATADPDDKNPPTWQTANGGYCGYYKSNEVSVGEFEQCVGFNGSGSKDCSKSTFTGEGSKCLTLLGPACQESQFDQGAECYGNTGYTCQGSHFTTGSICYANTYSCNAATFTSNSKCIANGDSQYACYRATFSDGAECVTSTNPDKSGCWGTILAGGKCIANNVNACHGTGFATGAYCVGEVIDSCAGFTNFKGTCVANAEGACAGNTYTGDGCCSGQYCPEDAKKCS